MNLDFFGLFLLLMGFVVGLGAVTVIDIHGFLGRNSEYWTEATTRTQKVTKPLVWSGSVLAILGGLLYFRDQSFSGVLVYLALLAFIVVVNGIFLHFFVSKYLLQREKDGKATELIPKARQRKIMASLIISDLGWWGAFALVIYWLTNFNS